MEILQFSFIPPECMTDKCCTTSPPLASPLPLLLTGSRLLLSKPTAFFIQLFKKTAFQREVHFLCGQHGTCLNTLNRTHPGCPWSSLLSLSGAPAHPAGGPEASHALRMLARPHSQRPSCLARPFLSFHNPSVPTSVPQLGVQCGLCRQKKGTIIQS